MRTIVFLIITLGIASATGRMFNTAPAERHEPVTRDSSAARTELPTSSVYHVDSNWTDLDGANVAWPSLQGQYRLVAFFFTHCGYACPRIVHDLKGILGGVPESDSRAVGVVLFSIDPERDTLEALQAYRATHELNRPQWTVLRGAEPDIRELAATLGVRYAQQSNGNFAHSNTIVLLDRNGMIAARRDGNEHGVQPIIDALSAAD